MRAAFQSFVAENTGQITWERLPPQAQRYFLTQAFSVRREMEAPLRDWLPRLTCGDLTPIAMPVLLIRGARTSDMFNKTMSALHRCLPHAREAVIANAGHCVPCDNPVEFNRVVLEFLQATAAPRGGRGVH